MPWISLPPQVYICSPFISPLELAGLWLYFQCQSHFAHFAIFLTPHSVLPFRLQAVKKGTFWASLVAQRLKCLPPMQETWVRSLGQEDTLEKEMVTHSSILAWEIPWTKKPGRLQSMGSQRVGHDWATWLSRYFLFSYLYCRIFHSVFFINCWMYKRPAVTKLKHLKLFQMCVLITTCMMLHVSRFQSVTFPCITGTKVVFMMLLSFPIRLWF